MTTLAEATTWSDYVLAALVTYGPLALGIALLLCGAGLPLPGSILLVAAGAFARQGMMVWHWAFLAALLGAVIGDNIAYGFGRLGGTWTETRFGNSGAWQSALDQFNRRGAWTIFLTRWLITPIGAIISMIAGISHFVWHRFLLLDVAGETMWVSIYWSIGWVLGSQWQAASTFLTDFSGLILGVSLLMVALVVGVRTLLKWRRDQDARELGTEPAPIPTSSPVEAMSSVDVVSTSDATA
jgi:membrane protein DedA with SNARE-associated domain